MQGQAQSLPGGAGLLRQRQLSARPLAWPVRPTRWGCAPGLVAPACGPRAVHAASGGTSNGTSPAQSDDSSPSPPVLPTWQSGRMWMGRAGCAAAAVAVAVSLLAGSASADLGSGYSQSGPAARPPPLAWVRLRDEPGGGVGGGLLLRAQPLVGAVSGEAAPGAMLGAGADAEMVSGSSWSSWVQRQDATPSGQVSTSRPWGVAPSAAIPDAATSSSGRQTSLPGLWLSTSSSVASSSSSSASQQLQLQLRAGPGPQLGSSASRAIHISLNSDLTPSVGSLRFNLDGDGGQTSAGRQVASGRGSAWSLTTSPQQSEQQRAARVVEDEEEQEQDVVLVGMSELASETEDRLLEAARQVESRLEGMFGSLSLQGGNTAGAASAPTQAAHALIREVWEVVDSNYLDARATGFDRGRWMELRDAALAVSYRDTAGGYRAVRDMLARGLSDPYCRFIGPPELEAMKKYDVSGVGVNLGTAVEYVVKTGNELPAPRDPAAPGEGVFVVGVSKGSPADVAGIRQGDELLAIQGESLAQATPFRAAGLISGAAELSDGDGADGKQQQRSKAVKEEVVRVTVRHGSGVVEELPLARPRRTLPSTVTTTLTRSAPQQPAPGGLQRAGEEVVGTVRLAAFNARAQSDVAAAIRQLESAGATRLVLDLRDNRGGLVTEGLEVARLFLDGDAPIVITERRDATPDTPLAPGPVLTTAPLLVLVNGHTASASEIVAGALHDNCRAVLAGSRTYGKGLIQSVYELSDGSGLVITVGKYLTPRGTDIDRFGINPDFSSVPSNAQYRGAVKACKLAALSSAPPLTGGPMAAVTPP